MGEWMKHWMMMCGLVLSMLVSGMAHAVGYQAVSVGDHFDRVAGMVKMERMTGKDPYMNFYTAWRVLASDSLMGAYKNPILLFDEGNKLVAITFYIEDGDLKEFQKSMAANYESNMNMVGGNNSRVVSMGNESGDIVLAQHNSNDLFVGVANHDLSAFLSGYWMAMIASDYDKSKSAQK